jgi:hypothetical protein
MTNEIRESITRLEALSPANLEATEAELTTLVAATQKEVTAQSNVLGGTGRTHDAYSMAAGYLVALLQLSQAAIEATAELNKLNVAAKKAVAKVLKKAPK